MDATEIVLGHVGLSDDGDIGLIRWMLSLTPEARLDVLQGFVDSVVELGDGRPA